MRAATSIMALAALGVGQSMASPTHAHLHRNAHQKRQEVGTGNVDWNAINWNAIGVNWKTVDYSNHGGSPAPSDTAAASQPVAPVAPAQTTPASAAGKANGGQIYGSPAAASASSSSAASSPASSPSSGGGGGSSGSSSEGLWKGLVGLVNDRTDFGQSTPPSGSDVSYVGNVGQPYGSSALLVDSTDGHDFTITVKNTASAPKSLNLWLKAGADGKANSGATSAPDTTTLTFVVPAGGSQVVAFSENVQGALCEATDDIHTSGAFATSWLEFNMVAGGPAWDVSAILDTKSYPMSATADETDCVTTAEENGWVAGPGGAEDPKQNGSGDCFIYGNAAHITVSMG